MGSQPPEGGRNSVRRSRPDLASCGGLVLALAGLIGGLILEGGKLQDISQVTAALIVLGGTCGAVMVTTPPGLLFSALHRLKGVFWESTLSADAIIEDIIGFATRARKNGIVSLEYDAAEIPDPFLRKALTLAVDGADLQELRQMMELEISGEEHRGEAAARVYEAAGGYAPTIGIIGAVMGLIQVMKHLDNIKDVGHGIAVAFVATVYGVGSANLLFLPVAGKIRARLHEDVRAKELMLDGVVGIVEGLNPKLIRQKLEAYTRVDRAPRSMAKSKAPPVAAAAARQGS
jgi:chemotaxis protein MotA